MGTVINLPPRESRGFGRGLADFLTEFARKRDERKRKEKFQKVISELLTTEQQNEAVLPPELDIAEEEPLESTLEEARASAGTTRVPRVDQPSLNEILGTLGEFMQPTDLANALVSARTSGSKRAPRTVTVFSKDGRQKKIEVPVGSPAISNVQQLGAAAPGADLEGFSLTQPGAAPGGDTDTGRLIAQLVKDGEPRSRAFRLAHKLDRIEIVPALGIARYISTVGRAVVEIPIGELPDSSKNLPNTTTIEPDGKPTDIKDVEEFLAGPDDEPQLTLMQLATAGTGPFSALRAGLARLAGFTGFPEAFPVPEETINARQGLLFASGTLVRELLGNTSGSIRAQVELENIRSELDFAPAVFDSTPLLQARIVSAHRSFKQKIDELREIGRDPSQGDAFRKDAKAMAQTLENFLPHMGVTAEQQSQSPGDIVPDGDAFMQFAGMTRDDMLKVDVDQLTPEEVNAFVSAYGAIGVR